MTTTLPTREEIAERARAVVTRVIDRSITVMEAHELVVTFAEKEIARLRPALETLAQENEQLRTLIATGQSRGAEISPVVRDVFAQASKVNAELYATIQERDTLCASLAHKDEALRACVEAMQAIVNEPTHEHAGCNDLVWIECRKVMALAAALARAQEAGR